MTVALVHYSAPPVVGGVESVIGQHARLMTDAGLKVTVVAGRGGFCHPQVRLVLVPLADSRHPRVLAAKASLDRGVVPETFAGLVEDVTSELRPALAGAQTVMAHNVCSLHKNLALTAALHDLHRKGLLPRLIVWHHDLAWTTPRYRSELHDGYPWDLLRTDWGARHVVVSEARRRELAELMGLPESQITVVPNGVDVARLLGLGGGARRLAVSLDLLSAAPFLLLPVRLTPRKNVELALEVLASLRELMPAARLVVTGPPGPHNAANAAYFAGLLERRRGLGLDDAAHFLAESMGRPVPDRVVAGLYRLSDALLLTSREEGFGIPLLEAAVQRVPVFCTAIPPLEELGQADVAYFEPDADPVAVAEVIASRLMASPTYRFAVRVRQDLCWRCVFDRSIRPLLPT